MNCTIRVVNEEACEIYIKELSGVSDPRQVLNKLRRARNIIEIPHVSTVHIEGDKNAFRIGTEKDTEIWLRQRIKGFKAIKQPEQIQDKGGEIGDSASSVPPVDGDAK
ncbi:hypothetical protein FACS1894106_1490 [Spirochaetia bacterium]|nr:hypothetical protein FACS1894106_1490 [Spirochaetia bacterium]